MQPSWQNWSRKMSEYFNESKSKMSRELTVLPSMCDGGSLLSIQSALDMFQDTATLHADNFDIGPEGMNRRRLFWIISKIRIHIYRMPEMMERVVSSTWIQAAERVSCERDYSITSGDEVLAYGRSVWAMISRDTGRLFPLNGLYPELNFDVAPPDERPFVRMNRRFEDAEEIGQYTIRSIDIDLGGHMNNVNYVRAVLGCFTSEELAEMDIKELEVNFISQSFEGETLRFVMRESEDSAKEIGAINTEGKVVFTCMIA